MCPRFDQFYKKVVPRLGEHGDVIVTKTVRFVHPKRFLANSVPGFLDAPAFVVVASTSAAIHSAPPSSGVRRKFLWGVSFSGT